MRVTAVSLRLDLIDRPGSRLVAVGSVELDGELRIEYVRVLLASDGRLVVAMPSRQTRVGEYRDTVHPTTPALRALIDEAVLAKYREESAIKPARVENRRSFDARCGT